MIENIFKRQVSFLGDMFKSGNAIALSCGLLVGLCCGFYLPLISFWMHDIGYSGNEIGVNMSSLAMLTCGVFIPKWLSKFGGYFSILGSILITMIVLALMPYFEALIMIYLMRFLWGLSFGVFWVASETWINHNASEKNRGLYISLYASLYGLGVFLGPQFLKLTGTEGTLPFFYGLIIFIPVTAALIYIKDKVPSFKKEKEGEIKTKLFSKLPLAFIGVMLSGACEVSFTNLFAIYGMSQALSHEQILSLLSIFALGNLLYQLPIGWLSDRFNIYKVMICNACLLIICLILIPFMVRQIWMYLVMFLSGGAIVGFYTLSLTLLGHGFKKNDLARANMLFIICFTVGGLFGPFINGYLVDLFPNLFMIFLAFINILYVGLIMTPRLRRTYIK